MAKQTKRSPQKVRQMQHPKQLAARPQRPWWLYGAAAVGLLGLAAALAIIAFRGGSSSSGQAASIGFPNTPDYHSLLVRY